MLQILFFCLLFHSHSYAIFPLNEDGIPGYEMPGDGMPEDDRNISLSHRLRIIEEKLNAFEEAILAGESEHHRNCNQQANGIHTIYVPMIGRTSFHVFCKFISTDSDYGNWTVVQRRVDDHIDFYRNWYHYKNGFGNMRASFFIGLENLYAMTATEPYELLIILQDFDGEQRYAKYDAFAIGDASQKYHLKTLGSYTGDAGDELTAHVGQKFTTYDSDNDNDKSNCAKKMFGAWWYDKCGYINLNGRYLSGQTDENPGQGIEWHGFRGHNYSLKFVEMLIRAKTN